MEKTYKTIPKPTLAVIVATTTNILVGREIGSYPFTNDEIFIAYTLALGDLLMRDRNKVDRILGVTVFFAQNNFKINHITELDDDLFKLEKYLGITTDSCNIFVESITGGKSKSQTSSNCFIATVCYGSVDCYEVTQFRLFRDHTLMKSQIGRTAVKIYYVISPVFASILQRMPLARNFVKRHVLNRLLLIIAHDRKKSKP